MSRSIIYFGDAPNDNKGESIRSAFEKSNSNFGELYAITNAAFIQANIAFSKANLSNDIVVVEQIWTSTNQAYSIANAAFNAANNGDVVARTIANDAYTHANNVAVSANDYAGIMANSANAYAASLTPNLGPALDRTNSVYAVANAAFDKANNSVTDFSPAFNQANDAYALANAAFEYANTFTPSINLSSLTDVSIDYGTISAGYVLKWDGSHWAAGIDSTSGGGGTDADTLEGQHGSYYLNYLNLSNTPNLQLYLTTSDASNIYATHTDLYTYANNIGNESNTWANSIGTSSNAWTNAVATSVNSYAISIGAASNTRSDNNDAAGNAWSNTVGTYANNWANTILSVGTTNATFNNVSATNITVGKITKLGGTQEGFGTYNSVTGATLLDCSSNYIFYITPSGNFTANLNNFTLDTSNVTSVTLVINQGVTPYMHTNYLYIGSANLTINWQGGTAPTGSASKKDIVTLSILNVAGSNTIFGQLVSFG